MIETPQNQYETTCLKNMSRYKPQERNSTADKICCRVISEFLDPWKTWLKYQVQFCKLLAIKECSHLGQKVAQKALAHTHHQGILYNWKTLRRDVWFLLPKPHGIIIWFLKLKKSIYKYLTSVTQQEVSESWVLPALDSWAGFLLRPWQERSRTLGKVCVVQSALGTQATFRGSTFKTPDHTSSRLANVWIHCFF